MHLNTLSSFWGPLYIAGFEYAIKKGFTKVVTIDGDGAHNPNDIPNLLVKHDTCKCHLTIGDRFTSGAFEKFSDTKKWANYFASHLMNRALGTALNDVACGLRVLEHTLIQAILEKSFIKGFSLIYDMIKIAKSMGFKICSYPVSVYYDASAILCTQQTEFLDYLDSIIAIRSKNTNIRINLKQFRNAISNFEPVTIIINRKQICLHPLLSEKGYLFQLQDPRFSDRITGRLFNLD